MSVRLAVRLLISMSLEDAKQVLGLPPGKTPSPGEIQKAYRAKAIENHPDRGGDTQKMVEINVAKEILEGKRRQDRTNYNPPKEDAETTRKRKAEIKRSMDIGNIEDKRDRAVRALEMAGDEIEYLLAGYRFSLKDFLLDEFATSVSTIHDEVLDGNPEGRDEQVWKKILPLTHGLSSYALRVATKFSKLMGLLLRVQNTGTFTDLKNLYVEFGKFLPELQKLRKISGELSKLINTEESLPMMWDNVFSKAHQKLISYDEDYRKHTTRSYVAAEAEIERCVDATQVLLESEYGTKILSGLDWQDWPIPDAFNEAIIVIKNAKT